MVVGVPSEIFFCTPRQRLTSHPSVRSHSQSKTSDRQGHLSPSQAEISVSSKLNPKISDTKVNVVIKKLNLLLHYHYLKCIWLFA